LGQAQRALEKNNQLKKEEIMRTAVAPKVGLALDGFYRIHIVETKGKNKGKIVGDSGWLHNLIPSAGLTNYISYLFAQSAGSSSVHYMALGSSQSSIASSASSLVGEIAASLRQAIGASQFTSRASSTSGDTVRFLATFASGSTMPGTIACIGLYATTTGSIFCGGSFASSTLGTTQAVNCTYDVVFTASTS
jgi:hypothetical protein